jgi:LacI family transcriptional regulator
LAEELLYINVLVEKQVDGLLFVAAGSSAEHIQALLARGMPLVVVDREVPGVVADRVFTDSAYGGRLAAQHLLDLGHHRIGCITGPSEVCLSADRMAGFQQTLAENNISIAEKLMIKGDFQYEGGYQATQSLLALEHPPTAIFACNDLMAIGATSAALELGRRVPADLSIIGFDDVRLASFTNPSLTTIAQPKYEMGVLAATMLLDRIHQPHLPPRRHLLETKLVIRQSTAPVGISIRESSRVNVPH